MSKPFASNNENINFSESVFTYATIGILLSDSLGKIVAANPFALQEFGYTEQELLGKHIEVLIPQRFRQKHSHYHDNFIIESRTRLMGSGLDLHAIKKDGTEFQVEISLSNFIKNNEQYVLSFIIDITARRKAENAAEIFQNKLASTIEQRTKALKATMQQLELANNKLNSVIAFQKAVLDNAGAMIIATDERGIIKLF
ncbi:MAG: PAS domain S-box protein [Chitinophagaceae bacterium]|nr:PAS domain S-box protein [Chitinophagaceae bacterium]